MRKTFWIALVLLSLLSIGATYRAGKLLRLTIINKSGMELEIKLTGSEDENFYVLRVPAGERNDPTEKVFTVAPDTYQIDPYYVELWDPVYGSSCGSSSQRTLAITRKTRITFFECTARLPNGGAPTLLKYPGNWRFMH